MTNQEILQLFLNRTTGDYLNALSYLKTASIDQQLLSYLLVIHLYHRNKDIRNEARSIFKKHASKELQELVKIYHTQKQAVGKRSLEKMLTISTENAGANELSPFETSPEIDLRECSLLYGYQNLPTDFKINFLKLYFVTTIPDSADILSDKIEYCFIQRLTSNNAATPKLDWSQVIEKCKQFPSLKALDVGSYNVYKEVPESILELKNLEHIRVNYLAEKIPDDLSSLSNLKFLHVDGNKSLRKLPEKLPAKMAYIDIRNTLFSDELTDYTRTYKQKHPQVLLTGYDS